MKHKNGNAMGKCAGWIIMAATVAGSGCATKNFEEIHQIDVNQIQAMSCQEIEQEFLVLKRHEGGVDEEATTGQAKQIFWGGLWSVMADEKLEHIARQKIRDRERLLYEAKLKKGCQ